MEGKMRREWRIFDMGREESVRRRGKSCLISQCECCWSLLSPPFYAAGLVFLFKARLLWPPGRDPTSPVPPNWCGSKENVHSAHTSSLSFPPLMATASHVGQRFSQCQATLSWLDHGMPPKATPVTVTVTVSELL